jgi:hypothetical protein
MHEPKVIGLAGVGLQVPDLAVAERQMQGVERFFSA